MLRRLRSYVALAPLVLAVATVAGCAKPDPLTSQLQAINASIARAFEQKKPEEITKYWSSNYTEVGKDGKSWDRNQAEALMRESMREFKTVAVEVKTYDVQSTAVGATATLRERFKGTTYHHIGADDRLDEEVTAKQTWVRDGTAWKLQRVDIQ